ncbi:MAG TPA: phosphotransferase, partial [Phnomibacter sp.]|nr:phosphotransferase [Phnomibacter sp.]
LQDGLINHTFKALHQNGTALLVQRINSHIFSTPQHIQRNYQNIAKAIRHLFNLPVMVPTQQGLPGYRHNNSEYWRCFTFINDGLTLQATPTPAMAGQAARAFAQYARALSTQQVQLHTIIPHFHNLVLRQKQLEEAIADAHGERLCKALPLIEEAAQYVFLVRHYKEWVANPTQYPPRPMHHDAKMSNLLFHKDSLQVITPIDLDTTQCGLFFSDLGDLIRSMVPSHHEHHPIVEDLYLKTDILEALIEAYTQQTENWLTPQEKAALHLSGPLLLYMQAIRFLTDFLKGDPYYQIQHPTQNLERTANQLRVLHLICKYFGLVTTS